MMSHWLAVASADHVGRGLAGGFMQVCHGKAAPLRRIRAGDGVVYYSPTAMFGSKAGLRAFTAIGRVCPRAPYRVEMEGDFTPFRCDVDWANAASAPIAPLLDRLALTADRRNWGYQLRFGLLSISKEDFAVIADAMKAPPVLGLELRQAESGQGTDAGRAARSVAIARYPL